MKFCAQIVTAISLLGGRAAAITAITDANIHAAVNTYMKSKTSATTLYGAIEEWDMSAVTDISYMTFLNGASLIGTTYDDAAYYYNDDWDGSDDDTIQDEDMRWFFNPDISAWDTSSVTAMTGTFHSCYNFDQDVSIWDMSGVTDMRAMFMFTRKFDRSLNAWDTSNVRKMAYMFNGASGMTHDMSPWDVSKVEQAWFMFEAASIIDIELCWSFPSSDDDTTADYAMYGSHVSMNPSADKCFCVAGEYHDGVTCTACANGYISYGKTKFCEACGADSTSNDKHTACVAGSLTPPPTPAPNADDESSDNDETDYQVAILVLASIIVFLLVVVLAAAGVFMFRKKDSSVEVYSNVEAI